MRLRLTSVRNREGVRDARFTYNERTKAYAKKAGLNNRLDDPFACVSS